MFSKVNNNFAQWMHNIADIPLRTLQIDTYGQTHTLTDRQTFHLPKCFLLNENRRYGASSSYENSLNCHHRLTHLFDLQRAAGEKK